MRMHFVRLSSQPTESSHPNSTVFHQTFPNRFVKAMFTRPVLYHPYKPSTPKRSPAGFRVADYINPRRCFNLFQGADFTNTRSPAPSPLNSPLKSPHHPDDDGAPPTLRLADFIANGFGSPTRPSAPDPHDHLDEIPTVKETNVPAQDPLSTSARHEDKRGPNHLSFNTSANRSGIFLPHRRAQRMKEKRDNARKRILDRHERRVARAREGLSKLRREAEVLMKPERMDDGDRVFLQQLERLELDQRLEHDLEQCRQRMARAAAEAPNRRREHAERDAEAAKLWGERQDKEALEEQQRHVAEFVRANEAQDAARFQRMEEAAMRMDEQRRRAHEALQRQIREEQERLFRQELARKAKEAEERRKREEQERRLREERERWQREERERRLREEIGRRQREEQERKLREERDRQRREEMERRQRAEQERRSQEERARRFKEIRERLRWLQQERERQKREEQERKSQEERARQFKEAREHFAHEEKERFAREDRERQARFIAEQTRRAAAEMEAQAQRHLALYEDKWHELRTNTSLPPVDVREMPWPVFGVVFSEEHITYEDVRTFLFHPQRPGVEGKTARDKVKAEVLRFHPDKFNTRILPKIQPSQQAVAQAIAGAVARILTRIMTEEVEQ